MADLEMLQAAFPDEVKTKTTPPPSAAPPRQFPLYCSFYLAPDSFVELEFIQGYPMTVGVQVSKYRSPHKAQMEAVVAAIRNAAKECLEDQVEGALACCAAALETWNDCTKETLCTEHDKNVDIIQQPQESPMHVPTVEWITANEPLVDRKSSFLAHVCKVTSEQQVHHALRQLIDGNSKLQRATHNMYAYRLSEKLPNGVVVNKFDNDDDGEHGAGQCLAHLLEMRGENGVLVLVSRWYGGTKLGPKRFAHITNVARELLVTCHEEYWKDGG